MLKDFGLDLKQLRESKNITIAEIAAQTRINPKFITNIESGIFDFQPDTYIRAFLKEYARCINESEEQILNDYGKAKAGFYSKKKVIQEPHTLSIKPVEIVPDSSSKDSVKHDEGIKNGFSKRSPENKKISTSAPEEKYSEKDSGEEYSNKSWIQKTLLTLVIIVGLVGLFYLYKTINKSDKHSQDVKPKTFSEISEDYENKIKGRREDTAGVKQDSLTSISGDSLRLTIKAVREVRIKVYVDEKRIVDEIISPRDSLNILAKQQFRFSASANSSVELYLNGKLLKKPSYLSSSSIKNLVINKDGITSQ